MSEHNGTESALSEDIDSDSTDDDSRQDESDGSEKNSSSKKVSKKTFRCDICGKTYQRNNSMQTHKLTHEGNVNAKFSYKTACKLLLPSRIILLF